MSWNNCLRLVFIICYAITVLAQNTTSSVSTYSNTIHAGNTAWMLTASALVMIMTPGLGLFYGGLTGANNAGNTILMSVASMCFVTIQWIFVGFTLSFSPGSSFIGDFEWGAMNNVAGQITQYGSNIPLYVYVAYQCMFAQITPALISGSIVGRMNFLSYILFLLLWSTLVYDPVAHWVWSLTTDPLTKAVTPAGWLAKLGAIDYAGGSVIHTASGFSALATSIMVGKRADVDYTKNEKVDYEAHNIPMVITGTALLWFGWFGFNAGSAGGADANAAVAFLNTHIAPCAAAVTWMIIETVHIGRQTLTGIAGSVVIGLVAITPGAGFVTPISSFIFGIVASILCYLFLQVKHYIGIDDTLDVFTVHGIGGVVGSLLTGLFAKASVGGFDGAFYGRSVLFGYQFVATITISLYAFTVTTFILYIMKYTIGIRVNLAAEKAGLDVAFHGPAYSSKSIEVVSIPTSDAKKSASLIEALKSL